LAEPNQLLLGRGIGNVKTNANVRCYCFMCLNLVTAELSGAFAPSYDFQFFFALTIGIIASKRADHFTVPSMQTHSGGLSGDLS
jgi:hypothetical protein